MWDEPAIKDVLVDKFLVKGQCDFGDALEAVFRALGMPRTLQEVGVGKDKLEDLPQGSLSERWCETNPVPPTQKEQVMEILKTVAGH